MKALFLICAEGATVDQRSNTLSLFKIIEELNISAFPSVISAFTIAVLITRAASEPTDVNDAYVRIELGNQEIFRHPTLLRFQERNRLRIILEIGGLLIPSPGELKATLNINGQELASWLIPVVNIGQPVVQNELSLSPIESEQQKPY